MSRLTFDIVKGKGDKKFLDAGRLFRIRYPNKDKEERIDIESKDLKHTKQLYNAFIKKADPRNKEYENRLLRIIIFEMWERIKELEEKVNDNK